MPHDPQRPEARYVATVVRDGDAYVARCEVLDLEGEGTTPEAAAASLKAMLVEHLQATDAVAPPPSLPDASFELVVTEVDEPGRVLVLRP